MSAYSDKLKDPRWQKKRLEVLERAGWKCEYCDEDTKTLHVHHGIYWKDFDPWNYPDVTLHCLCEDCHSMVQIWMEEIKDWMGSISILKLAELAEDIIPDFDVVCKLYWDHEHGSKAK
jgi:hypothetical protein